MPTAEALALRQCVLAVSVLGDLDVVPRDNGVLLPGPHGVVVEWTAIRHAVGPHPSHGPTARRRVENLLRLHRLAIDLGPDAAQRFHAASRLVALPPEHAEHPGPGWSQESLRGQALELGIGVHGLLDRPDRTVALPPSVLHALRISPAQWWPRLREHAERMGALSASRLTRDGVGGVIRPVGGCDVLALLASRTLRKHLSEGDGSGLRSLAAPTRRRAWYDLHRIDPAFVQAAWDLTDEVERGLRLPLLVTTDEVTLPFMLA